MSIYPRRTMRAPEVQARYDEERKKTATLYGDNPPCPFCDNLGERIMLRETSTMIVVKNDFPYQVFDGLPVSHHILLVPRRHTAVLDDFDEQEIHDYWHLVSEYHLQGYSFMTRSAKSTNRSVPAHLHTHLFTVEE